MQRIKKFIENLPSYDGEKKVDSAIITSYANRLYFTGFKSTMGFLLLTKEESYFIVDFRYYEAALKTVKNMRVVEMGDLSKTLEYLIKKHNIKGTLIENEGISLALADKLDMIFKSCGKEIIKTKTLDKIIFQMRSIKDKQEIEKIKNAQEISENAFNYILTKIKPGVSELDLAIEIELFIRRNGADSIAFDLIVLSGENGSVPHGTPGENTIKLGDFVTIDIGAVFEGYHSDMTRTVAVGSVNNEQQKVYNTVLKAQLAALENIRPGVRCSYIDKIARDIIDNSGYKGKFGHSLGHGVGLDIHEAPRLSQSESIILSEGMVIKVEPGIYINSKFGVRIEDIVIVNESGYENLTTIPKNLIVL